MRARWILLAMSVQLGACAPEPEATPLPRRVLVIGVDGVRGDAFADAATPALDAFFGTEGLRHDAQIHVTGVAVSGPGWASILTGVEVDDHGVLNNDQLDRLSPTWPPFPGTVQDAGHEVAVLVHWEGVLDLVGRERVDLAEGIASDAGVSERAVAVIETGAHDLVFLHLDDVDHTGHGTGFDPTNPDYIAAIETVDTLAGPVLDAVQADTAHDWVVLLTSDHGGQGTSHGIPNAENRTIPQGGWGTGIALPPPSYHMDIAATALDVFGLPTVDLDGQSWLASP